MTITAQTSKTGPYSGNGTTTVFSYTFEVQDEAHLVVTLADSQGVETVQVLNTDYTVSGVGNANGGQITMVVAPATGSTLTISRNIPITQEVDLENRRSVAPEVLEDAYDKLTQIAQDFSEQLGRSIKVPVSSTVSDTTISEAISGPSVLGFDASNVLIQYQLPTNTSAPYLAQDVNITDAGGYFSSSTVEGALQETALATFPQYTPPGAGAQQRSVQARLRDFITPYDFGAVGDGVSDDTAALQAFFDAIEADDYGTAVANGEFLVTSALTLTAPATKVILGDCRIKAGAAIDNVFTLTDFDYGYWEKLRVTGTGGPSNYANITCNTGLYLVASGRAKFGFLYAQNFKFAGICCVSGNSNMVSLGHVATYDCGSGCTYHPLASVTGSWSNPVNSGSSGSTGQSTTIDVTNLPPDFILDNTYAPVGDMSLMVRIDGYLYYIQSIDQANSKLTVYPWLPSTATPGTFEYVFGGGVYLRGSDTNVFGIDMVDATRCGIGLCVNSLYGANARRIVTQFCGSGIVIGNDPAAAMLGGHYDGIYFEANDEDIIVTQTQGSNSYNYFGAEYALNLAKCYILSAPRLSSDALSPGFEVLSRNPLRYRGRFQEAVYGKSPINYTGSSIALSPHERSGDLVYYRNTVAVGLQPLDDDLNRLFAGDCAKITFIGGGASSEPTGTITFNPPSGWTVNGGATAAFTGFTAPVTFAAFWDISATNVIVAEI